MIPPPVARGRAAASDGVYKLQGGHVTAVRGARAHAAARPPLRRVAGRSVSWGLTYTPVEETFARIVQWAVAEGLVED